MALAMIPFFGAIGRTSSVFNKILNTKINGKTIKALSEANINNSGITVLGHHPGYLEKAIKKKASYFDVGKNWDNMTDIQRGVANVNFLDVIADRGDDIILSVAKKEIRPGSSLANEIKYLIDYKGYKWVNQWSLKKGGK